jgi:hypothetical protein
MLVYLTHICIWFIQCHNIFTTTSYYTKFCSLTRITTFQMINFMFCWTCISVLFLYMTNLTHNSFSMFTTRSICFIYVSVFQFSTCFQHPCAHHQQNQLYQYNIWYVSLCVGDRLVCRSTCILDGHLHRVTYTRCIDTVDSHDDEHGVDRNM